MRTAINEPCVSRPFFGLRSMRTQTCARIDAGTRRGDAPPLCIYMYAILCTTLSTLNVSIITSKPHHKLRDIDTQEIIALSDVELQVLIEFIILSSCSRYERGERGEEGRGRGREGGEGRGVRGEGEG